MSDPLFTVLMPAYNTESYITSAILSVCNQIYTNWELLIVIDPGTTDKTYEVATKAKKSVSQYNKIRIIYGDKPKLPHVTAYGIKEASGSIIGVLDSDDQLYPESLKGSVHAQMKDPKVGFTWSKVRLDTGSSRGGYHSKYKDMYSAFMCSGWWQSQHFRTFKKSWYNKSHGLRTQYPYAVDFNLALCMAESGCKCVFIQKYLYWYRSKRPTSMTNTTKPEQRQCYRDMKKEWRALHTEDERVTKKSSGTPVGSSRGKTAQTKSIRKAVGIKSKPHVKTVRRTKRK